jgi:hypothetical protein
VLKNKLLLTKDNFGQMAWQQAALGDSLEALETLWSWAKELELNTDELLTAEDKHGNYNIAVSLKDIVC